MPKDGSKRKDTGKDRAKARSKKTDATLHAPSVVTGSDEEVVAGSMGATSMGPIAARPALPGTREELTQLWLEARRRRDSAALGSDAFRQAAEDVARIEVEIAAVERALTPPRV